MIAAPVKLFVSVTNRCNVKCLHCMPDSRVALPGELSAAEILGLVDQAAEMGVPRIAFTGGEPTLHPNIMAFLRRASEKGLRVDLETSASRYRPGYVNALADAGLKVLCLSLDSAASEGHDSFRGVPGLFRKVVAAAAEGSSRGLDVRVYCSVSPQNIESALQIVDLFEERKINIGGLTFAPVTPVGRAEKDERLRLHLEDWKDFFERFERKRQCSSINMRIERMVLPTDELKTFKAVFPHDFSCIARERRYIYVNPQGRAYGCSLLTGTRHELGSVRSVSLLDIWMSSAGWDFFGPRPSNDDEMRAACAKGCPALDGRPHLPKRSTSKVDEVLICPMVQTPQIDVWNTFSPAA